MAMSIMIQGTGSNVGKSLLVAGLARALVKRGLRVAPFKPQNMSNNAAVTVDGGEIGRAQALQARAAGLDPVADMNPVLLKPETDIGAQVVVQGQRLTTVRARDYATLKPKLMTAVIDSFTRLSSAHDIVVVEGAGSAAETNLRQDDIANLGFAERARVPVVLTGDIDRGGVIAQLVGTHAILPQRDRDLVNGFLVNKFRGDASLFADGATEITARTGWPNLGIVPWFEGAHRLPAEDALDIQDSPKGEIVISVPQLSRMANFDDLDPLKNDPGVAVRMVPPGTAIGADTDLVILPGSKSTIGEMAYLRTQGWDIDIRAHVRRGGAVLGICGGYQMLGTTIMDPHRIESDTDRTEGLGLLDVTTTMHPRKNLTRVTGRQRTTGTPLVGYEIHIGETNGPDTARAWLEVEGRPEGAASADGRIMGTYVHGLFAADDFRQEFLRRFRADHRAQPYEAGIESTLDALASHIEANVDIEAMLDIAKSGLS